MSKRLRILGVDPGSRILGFGLVEVAGRNLELVSYGLIAPPPDAGFHSRIGVLAGEFEMMLDRFRPDVVVIEQIFLGKNADSAFKLGHARGVVVASASRSGAEIVEYAARTVKKGITGNGAASKVQVQLVLNALFSLRAAVKTDASDALALAVYHARCLEVATNIVVAIARLPEAGGPEGIGGGGRR